MAEIWIACWDCGEQTKVPELGKYQTRQICGDCKQERKLKYERLLTEPR
jgi:hypothetical protein